MFGLLTNTNYLSAEHEFEHKVRLQQLKFINQLHLDSPQLNNIMWTALAQRSMLTTVILNEINKRKKIKGNL